MVDDQFKFENVALPLLEMAYEDWIELARETAITVSRTKGQVTSDDVWELCPPPPHVNPKAMGALYHPRKNWTQIGFQKSSRNSSHGRTIGVWKYEE